MKDRKLWQHLSASLSLVVCLTLSLNAFAVNQRGSQQRIGTWASAPQPAAPNRAQKFRNKRMRLIVHTCAGGTKSRFKLSNVFGDQPLLIGGAHLARRTTDAEIDTASDRRLTFRGHASTTVPAHAMVVSDPVDLDVPALSDLAISLFLPNSTVATTAHSLALQTNYVSPETGDATAEMKFPVGKTIASRPFLTGVDVAASPRAAAIVAFGSSTTDGDGSTKDANKRWPDVLAERLLESYRAWPCPRVCDRATSATGFARRGPGSTRLTLPGMAPARKPRLYGCGLEAD